MSRPDYQGTLGFELVKLTTTSGDEVHMLRETGAEDRVATLEERVLWDALVTALDALRYYRSESFDGYAQPNGAVAGDAITKIAGGAL